MQVRQDCQREANCKGTARTRAAFSSEGPSCAVVSFRSALGAPEASSLAMQHAHAAAGRASALAARCRTSLGPCSATPWLAAAALCTACSFTPRVAPVTAWGMFPAALASWLAAHKDPACDAQLKHSLGTAFYLTFVATQAAASTIGVFGILQGPGVPPLAGHVALVPICIALWLLLALPFALHVAFARRCVCMSCRAAGASHHCCPLQFPRVSAGRAGRARGVDRRMDSHRRAKPNWRIREPCCDPGAKPACAAGCHPRRRRNRVHPCVARRRVVVRAAAQLAALLF